MVFVVGLRIVESQPARSVTYRGYAVWLRKNANIEYISLVN